MTQFTPPAQNPEWEPTQEGIRLHFNSSKRTVLLPMSEVRELAHDMEEAAFMARGYEKKEVYTCDVFYLDMAVVLGDTKQIRSVLTVSHGRTALEFLDGEEVTLQSDRLVTVWRKIE